MELLNWMKYQARVIKTILKDEALTVLEIARYFNVKRGIIDRIKHNVTWKQINL